MAAAYLLGLFFILGLAQGGVFNPEPAIIEDLPDYQSSRIVAGWPAEEGQIPYQCSLRMVNNAGGVSSCGCSLIDNQWVLTAAHCLANRITFVVRLGVTNLTRPEIIVETSHKFIHPEYDEIRAGVQTADLALTKLENPIEYSDNVQPSRLMSSSQKNINFAGVQMVVSGFGRTDDLWNGGAASEILLWTYQRGVSNEECLSWYPGSQVIKDETICAGFYDNPSQSSCQGDSGGPLTIVDADGERTQVGIVSFGSNAGCNSPWPSGYVRPGHYHDWFTEVTGINFDWDSDLIEPTTEDAPATDDAPTTEDALTTEDAPATEDALTTEDAPATEDAPTTEDAPSAEDSPSSESASDESPSSESAESSEEAQKVHVVNY